MNHFEHTTKIIKTLDSLKGINYSQNIKHLWKDFKDPKLQGIWHFTLHAKIYSHSHDLIIDVIHNTLKSYTQQESGFIKEYIKFLTEQIGEKL